MLILHPKYRCNMLRNVNLSFKTFLRRFAVWQVHLTSNWPPKLHQPVSFAFLLTCISKRSSSDVNKTPLTQAPNPTPQITERKTYQHVALLKTFLKSVQKLCTHLVHAVLLYTKLSSITMRSFGSRLKFLLFQGLVFLGDIFPQCVDAETKSKRHHNYRYCLKL